MSMFTDMSKTASRFMPSADAATLAVTGLEIGIVASLFTLGTMNSTTPEQRMAAQAQDDQAKANAMMEDARNKEAQADEDRRRAYFANQGPSF